MCVSPLCPHITALDDNVSEQLTLNSNGSGILRTAIAVVLAECSEKH